MPKVINRRQARALLEQPNVSCPTGLRNRVILEVMYRAGLRVSEVVSLKPGHIRWPSGELAIKDGKGGVDRVVPVDQETTDWLGRWDEQRPKIRGRFFTTLQGKPLSPRYIWGMVKRAAQKAEVDPNQVSPHVLRHSYASEKLEEGFTLAEVQQLLGHANVQTTSVYLHVNPKDLREKIQSNGHEGAPAEAEAVKRLATALAALPKEHREALAKALMAAE